MEFWKQTIQQANRAFAQQQYQEALELYSQCIAISMEQWHQWYSPKESMEAIVTSYHNRVHLLIKLEQREEAELNLQELQDFLESERNHYSTSSNQYSALLSAIATNFDAINNNDFDVGDVSSCSNIVHIDRQHHRPNHTRD